MVVDLVLYLEVQALEPIAVRGSYGVGGFYRSPNYIPSSTLAGSLINEYYQSGSQRGDPEIWVSHAFPGPPPELGKPPALSPRTLSLKPNGELASVALTFAEAIRDGPGVLSQIQGHNPKVSGSFILHDCSRVAAPKKSTEIHVALDYERRTHAIATTQGGETGLLFTQEVILPFKEGERTVHGQRFHALAFLNEPMYDFLKEGIEVRVGSMRSKGYGLVRVAPKKVNSQVEVVDIDQYRNIRSREISRWVEEEWLVADVLNQVRPQFLHGLGRVVFKKVTILDAKFWYMGNFHLYRGIYGPGSVFVLENPVRGGSMSVNQLVRKETTPPQDPVDMIHGMDMLFFDNPAHFNCR